MVQYAGRFARHGQPVAGVGREDHIARCDASPCRWAVRLDLGYQSPLDPAQTESAGDARSNALNFNPERPARDDSLFLELPNYRLYGRGRMANPMPTEPPDGEEMTVLIPTTFPSRLRLGLQNCPSLLAHRPGHHSCRCRYGGRVPRRYPP
jgi:hypothetical protein